ncbi:single-stranded DNA-binding protein [Natronogracilivirga saccharolytica]|uniref:Single-stranded DNA-binding protein n=1 Tax=Natronogracilivirga saccharolytica TaxID=2812953 RepID=A0A8J7SAR1_9BACT|nr:single-stranded DNA-binding protein [Natronogracilivirga saccharolytica]MBP3193091.1 single-stranded DNA-binding protein [Natronogracilivirga saccharolytica]
MGSLNKAMIIGRLGADPEVRYTQNNTAVANMSVATSDRYKDGNGEWQERTEWHRVVAWGRLAEVCQQYLKKGSQVYFEGPIQTRSWEDKEGQKQYTTEIKALGMQMLDSRGADQNENMGDSSQSGSQAKTETAHSEVSDVDDDLPF